MITNKNKSYTIHGKEVKSMPVAMANGIEWMNERKKYSDRFYNLYSLDKAPANWFLWLVGAFWALVGRRAV